MKGPMKQKLVSFVSSVVFLGFLWVLFKKMIIVTWISMPWWALILLLIGLFFFIETMVARTVGAREPAERAGDSAKEALSSARETVKERSIDGLDAVKAKLAEREKQP
jgi:protein-S-isoprenylcysteine O-methyltransferase Ste14